MKNQTLDPRIMLESEFRKRRAKNSRYSLRAFSKHLGIPSGRLSELLSSKRTITLRAAEKIAKRLELSPIESHEFVQAVRRQHALTTEPTQSYVHLAQDQFELIAGWEHFAILNLIQVKGFMLSPDWIGKRLGILPLQARMAIERLTRMGLVKVVDGQAQVIEKNLATTTDIPSQALKRAHKEHLKLAEESLDRVPVELRDITSISMPIDVRKLKTAKEMIKNFRRQLCDYLEEGQKTEVYHLSVQLFPLTHMTSKESK